MGKTANQLRLACCRTVALTALGLIGAACHDVIAPDIEPALQQSTIGILNGAYSSWKDSEPRQYSVTVTTDCGMCVLLYRNPTKVWVQDGKVTALRDLNSGNWLDFEAGSRDSPIDVAFDMLFWAHGRNAEVILALYDSERGFPLGYNIDLSERWVDDEFSLRVRDFRVISR